MKFGKGQEDDFRLDMTPMIDVIFLLLIFFMVSTAFVDFSKKMDIVLPESSASEEMITKEELTIEMTKGGKVFLDGKVVRLETLRDVLDKKVQSKKKLAIIIRADKKIEYGKVIKILGYCKELKIDDVAVAVK